MIAVDTNLLIYAHRRDSPWYERASASIRGLAGSPSPWAIPWPCLHEFISIASHPKIYTPPTSIADTLQQVQFWLDSPSVVLLSEEKSYWKTLQALALTGQIRGPIIHDAKIAALCLTHGVRELWTADRDFSRFPALRTRNPLVA